MNKISKLDFKDQRIYVGMDIHTKSWSISILTDNFEHKTFTQPPNVEVLVNYLKRNFPGGSYKSVYEAGYCGFWIHDRLQEHGVQCFVVNPADVPTKDKERRSKTDRVTAASWQEIFVMERSRASMSLAGPRWKTVALSELDTVWLRNRRAARTRSNPFYNSTGFKYRKNWRTVTGPSALLPGSKQLGWNVPAAILP